MQGVNSVNGVNVAAIQSGLLKFAETVVYGALVAGAQAAVPLLNASSFASVDWASIGHTFLAAALVALLIGLRSYHVALPGALPASAPLDRGDPTASSAPTSDAATPPTTQATGA